MIYDFNKPVALIDLPKNHDLNQRFATAYGILDKASKDFRNGERI